MIDWVSIVRHSRRRFSVLNFAGGGRQRRNGNFLNAPKQHHHRSMTIPPANAIESTQSDEKLSSTCCFSNVRFFLRIYVTLFIYFFMLVENAPKKQIISFSHVKLKPYTW